LLTEYFAFPAKFAFFDVAGWEKARRALGVARAVDLVIFLNRTHTRLEQLLEPAMVRLGCTPAGNLFRLTAEPIPLTHTEPEYKIIPEVGHPLGYEVYSVSEVIGAGVDGKNWEYRPFYHYQHGGDRDTRTTFWYASRRQSLAADDRGTDVYLHLVDSAF